MSHQKRSGTGFGRSGEQYSIALHQVEVSLSNCRNRKGTERSVLCSKVHIAPVKGTENMVEWKPGMVFRRCMTRWASYSHEVGRD